MLTIKALGFLTCDIIFVMGFRSISKYFPPLQYLKPNHIGVSFSDSSIKVFSFGNKLNDPEIKNMLVPLENGTIISGSVTNMGNLVKKLSLVKEKFSTPFVFFTISDELAYVFTASVPIGNGGDLTERVAFIMEENVPLPLSDITFDFVPTKIVRSSSEDVVSIVVSAGVKREIEKFMEAFRQSGFEPIGCIHESQAIAKSVIPRNFSKIAFIIHARENRLGIHMIKDNTVIFSTLRATSYESYEKDFLDEYEKFLDYCEKYDALESQSAKSVFVCGEFEYAKKVVETLGGYGQGPKDVKLSNVWTNILNIDEQIPETSFEKSLSFAGSIGATLSDLT